MTDDDADVPVSAQDKALDAMDLFNHPRQRRALILSELRARDHRNRSSSDVDTTTSIRFECPTIPESSSILADTYGTVHSEGLLSFLETAWEKWENMGQEGRDPMGFLDVTASAASSTVPPLVPGNVPLPRTMGQRPSRHVLGQVGYYCTDTCTPVFGALRAELHKDAALVRAAVAHAQQEQYSVSYVLPTHPGHHAATVSFGGYCYVNHAAAIAKTLSLSPTKERARVAILDVDYHCGNGTDEILDEDASILVVSIHCDPDHEYPFHSGFADQTGSAGTTLHLPLPPRTTTWEHGYRTALTKGLDAIVAFAPSLVVVSLGLDTYDQDPCAIRRAGFGLQGDDYVAMGQLMARKLRAAPLTGVVFVQEGGYRMDRVPEAAANVVLSFCQENEQQQGVVQDEAADV